MRLIDADAIRYTDLNADMPQSKVRVWVTFKEWIDAMPTVEERKTGKWEQYTMRHDYGSTILWECTSCKKLSSGTYNYCPNCGSHNGGNDEE